MDLEGRLRRSLRCMVVLLLRKCDLGCFGKDVFLYARCGFALESDGGTEG